MIDAAFLASSFAGIVAAKLIVEWAAQSLATVGFALLILIAVSLVAIVAAPMG